MAHGLVSALVLSAIVLFQVNTVVSAAADVELTDAEFLVILNGRCEDYTEVLRKTLKLERINCDTLTKTFQKIFNGKKGDACKSDSYKKFVEDYQHPVPRDKGLLWSGVYEIQKLVAMDGQRFFPIRLTLIGYILDNINWCGTDVFKSTKGCEGCNAANATRAFWEKASEYFAKNLLGKIHIILSAREGGTFSDKSILHKIEIPNLPKAVTSVEVWPVRQFDVPRKVKTERCGEGSLKELKKAIGKQVRKASYKCVNDEKLPVFAMCIMQPDRCDMPYTAAFMTAPSLWTVVSLTVGYFLLHSLSLC